MSLIKRTAQELLQSSVTALAGVGLSVAILAGLASVQPAEAAAKKPPCGRIAYEGLVSNPKLVRLVCADGTEVTANVSKLKWNKPKSVSISAGSGKHRHTIVKILKAKDKKDRVIIVIWYDNGKKDKTADNATTRNLYTGATSAS